MKGFDTRRLAVALGLSAVALLPAWDAILSLSPALRDIAPLAWVLGATLLLAGLLMACRFTGGVARAFSVLLGVVLCVLLGETVAYLYVDLKNVLAVRAGPHYFLLRNAIGAACLAAVLALAALAWRRGPGALVAVGRSTFSLLGALPVVLVASYLMGAGSPPPAMPGPPARHVVALVILDELDTSAVDADIAHLPNFRALREKAFSASRMFPPANYTAESLPGIVTGESFEDAVYSRQDVHVRLPGQAEWGRLSHRETLFSDAAKRGLRTTLIGWHLPYCRMALTGGDCWDDEAYKSPGAGVGLPAWLLGHSKLYAGFEARQMARKAGDLSAYSQAFMTSAANYRLRHIGEIFGEQRRRLLAAVSGRSSEFVFAHLACPHAPALLAADVDRQDMYAAYASNLRTCDQLLGEVTAALAKAGYPEGSTLIVTSDHWFRGLDWKDAGRPLVSPVGRRPVPFYLSLDGQDGTAFSSDALSNSRVLRKLVAAAAQPGFSYAKAKAVVEAQGDSPTVLRPF